ncbi:hypothetical protein [Hymenobacter terrigena]
MKHKYWLVYVCAFEGLLTSCVPQAFPKTDYGTHLTSDERQLLKQGRPIDKIHTSYWRFKPSQLYYQGPLRAQPDSVGKVHFTPHGMWQRWYKSGAIKDTTVYSADGKASYVRYYREDGSLYLVGNTVPRTVAGRPCLESVDIEFGGSKLDTVMIRRWGAFEHNGNTILDERIEFDSNGHRKAVIKVK